MGLNILLEFGRKKVSANTQYLKELINIYILIVITMVR